MTAKKPAAHPNRIPFAGLLTRLGVPSDKAPSGARGHRVIVTMEAALEALESLELMAVGFEAKFEAHNPRQKCGVITEAFILGDELRVKGYLYCRDFPEIAAMLEKPDVEMGMSYEMCDAHVADMREKIWTLTRVTFTGAAILLRAKAAYRSTSFALQGSADRFTGKLALVGKVKTGRAARSSKHC